MRAAIKTAGGWQRAAGSTGRVASGQWPVAGRSRLSARTRVMVIPFALATIVLAAACSGEQEAAPAAAAQPQAVKIGQESVATVTRDQIKTGPLISGELRPEREATVRAEVGGSVLEVLVDEARPVRQGAVLARIEAQALTDAQASAQSAVRSAEQALRVSEREAERTETLVKGGALAERDLETTRNAVVAAQAQLADARSRLASASKQLADTVIRAPISGIVSERPVNRGDVVAPGAPHRDHHRPVEHAARGLCSIGGARVAPCGRAGGVPRARLRRPGVQRPHRAHQPGRRPGHTPGHDLGFDSRTRAAGSSRDSSPRGA